MSALLDVESEETSFAPPKKYWTHEEYYHLYDSGMLKERCELLSGEITLKMPQNLPHIVTVFGIAKWLRQVFGYDYIHTQMPVSITDASGSPSDPEPDAVVFHNPIMEFTQRIEAKDVVMVVEVSASTLGYDRTTKAEIYAAGGIAEYWILNVNARQVYIYRNPTESGYSLIIIASENEEIAPLDRLDAKVRVGDLFPPADA